MSLNRITYLDVLRGIAICFICFANIPFFAGTAFMPDEMRQLSSTPMLDTIL